MNAVDWSRQGHRNNLLFPECTQAQNNDSNGSTSQKILEYSHISKIISMVPFTMYTEIYAQLTT